MESINIWIGFKNWGELLFREEVNFRLPFNILLELSNHRRREYDVANATKSNNQKTGDGHAAKIGYWLALISSFAPWK